MEQVKLGGSWRGTSFRREEGAKAEEGTTGKA